MSSETANAILQYIVEMEYPDYQGYCPTVNDFRKWMPAPDGSKAIPFLRGQLGIEDEAALQEMPKDPEPTDWQTRFWYRLERCIQQQSLDVPIQTKKVEVRKTFKPPNTDFEIEQDVTELKILNPKEIKLHAVAATAGLAIFTGWNWNNDKRLQEYGGSNRVGSSNREAGIIAVHKLWEEVEKRHPREFFHPIAAILPMRECAANDCDTVFHLKHIFYTTGGKRKFCSERCRNRIGQRNYRHTNNHNFVRC